jgi:hypothetical protein
VRARRIEGEYFARAGRVRLPQLNLALIAAAANGDGARIVRQRSLPPSPRRYKMVISVRSSGEGEPFSRLEDETLDAGIEQTNIARIAVALTANQVRSSRIPAERDGAAVGRPALRVAACGVSMQANRASTAAMRRRDQERHVAA